MSSYFITKESQVTRKFSLRDLLRHVILDILSISNPFRGYNKRNHIQFIYLHSVHEDQKNKLRSLIQNLAKSYQFISYSDAVNRIKENRIDQSYACFSLDDGFKNNLNAVEVFNEFNISACFFVCPAYVGMKDEQEIKLVCQEVFNSQPLEFMDWDDLNQIYLMGHEIGGHTQTHINLAQHSVETIQAELTACYDAIKSHFKRPIHFAYPYGRYIDCPKNIYELILQSGFITCASAERGCHINNDDSHKLLIRREHILLNWKMSHITYFLKRNKYSKLLQSNSFNQLVN